MPESPLPAIQGANASIRPAYFEEVSSPLNPTGRWVILLNSKGFLSVQRSLNISFTGTTAQSGAKAELSERYSLYGKMASSMATLATASLLSHSSIDGVPAILSFISSIPLPCNSFSACTKYLESVHKAALFRVTANVPADPVKPLSHSLTL